MITLTNVNKTYYTESTSLHVLKGIDLHIASGEYVSIMGASGSGKSTLLNILGILDNYDLGEYHLNGTLIKNLSEKQSAAYRNEMIGFVFQSFNLINFKNALENVALPLYYKNVSRKRRNIIAMDYLDQMGLKDWALHMPSEMSGGQKQRVALARAMMIDPKIIGYDEPTSALDPALRDQVANLILENKKLGMTQIVVTHDMDFAEKIADTIIKVNAKLD